LRPSIETSVHAILPQRVVVHVDCVETIACACLEDAERRLADKLAGFNWTFIPYVRPGLLRARSWNGCTRTRTCWSSAITA
jgi:rhamnose utilization protein RhaD (predicted bifunctional aldolase and dehydrogenase)